eukprot:622690-Rhodomonas_salina.1
MPASPRRRIRTTYAPPTKSPVKAGFSIGDNALGSYASPTQCPVLRRGKCYQDLRKAAAHALMTCDDDEVSVISAIVLCPPYEMSGTGSGRWYHLCDFPTPSLRNVQY